MEPHESGTVGELLPGGVSINIGPLPDGITLTRAGTFTIRHPGGADAHGVRYLARHEADGATFDYLVVDGASGGLIRH